MQDQQASSTCQQAGRGIHSITPSPPCAPRPQAAGWGEARKYHQHHPTPGARQKAGASSSAPHPQPGALSIPTRL